MRKFRTPRTAIMCGCCMLASIIGSAMAGPDEPRAKVVSEDIEPYIYQRADGKVIVGGREFASWQAYGESDFFRQNGLRCTFDQFRLGIEEGAGAPALFGGNANDCTINFTDPDPAFDPSVVKYRIPVAFHVIRTSGGSSNVSQTQVQSQIDIMNEDFLALPGTNGAPGTDVQIEFYLATEDPSGNATNGITYSNNTTWYNDGGGYYNSLAWDPDRYLNIYSNSGGGALGYVPFLPQEGSVGSNTDRVVVLWSTVGRNAPFAPFNQGRTVTHEVGHYLGLFHVFDFGCGTSSCYNTGDRICDTVRQSNPTGGCSNGNSCGNGNNRRNYMDYSDDTCMWEFTPEQAKRMRCTLENYRPQLWEFAGDPNGRCCLADGSCQVITEQDCLNIGGNYQGDFGNCVAQCPEPTGACCTSIGCVDLSQTNCGFAGGQFFGVGTTCQPTTCGDPEGACCLTDGSCATQAEADCNSAGGGYQGDGSDCGGAQCAIACPWDCAPAGGNGVVNFDDLVAIINAISTQDLACDVAPDNGNGTFGNGFINFDDLVAAINHFGSCP